MLDTKYYNFNCCSSKIPNKGSHFQKPASRTNFNVIFPATPTSPNLPLPFMFSFQHFIKTAIYRPTDPNGFWLWRVTFRIIWFMDQWVMLALSKGPNRAVSPSLYLKTEIGPVSKMFCFYLFKYSERLTKSLNPVILTSFPLMRATNKTPWS
jgi:hypothetical protein